MTALAVVLLGAAAVSGSTDHRPPGWQVVWLDDFDGARGSLPSSRDWIVDTGTGYPGGASSWGTGEVQTYTADPSTIALDGRGNLTITPRRDSAGAWTSGRVETRRSEHSGFFLLLDVAIGGGFPDAGVGTPTAATVPDKPMVVDHVSVSTKARR